jgi:hypothetical protein
MDEPKDPTVEAEIAAALSDAPPDPLANPAPGPEAPPQPPPEEQWRPFMGHAVTLTDRLILPQWDLSDEEKTELRESLCGCLAQLFPDGPNGKYACWFRLAAVALIIPTTRYVDGGGRLPPLGPRRKKADDADADQQTAGDPGSPEANAPVPV